MSRLAVVLRFPHFFLHPLIDGFVGDSGCFVKRVENLVTHAPPRVGSFKHKYDASTVTLIRIVVDRDAGTKLIEGNLLGITKAGMNDFHLGTIWFEAQDSTLVRIFVF